MSAVLDAPSYRLTTADREVLAQAAEIRERAFMRRPTLPDPQATRNYLRDKLAGQVRECFMVLYLDGQHAVIELRIEFVGTINSASVYPREIVRRCIETGASAVIFAHNHPSGVAEPSAADRDLTQRLKDSLSLIDVRVLDHIVIGGNHTVSFAERGLL